MLTTLTCLVVCVCAVVGLCGLSAEGMMPPLDLGFKGDNTFRGGTVIAGNVGTSLPVTFRRIAGRAAADEGGRPGPREESAGFSCAAENPEKGVESAPNACLRDFSCLPCTDLKCRRSSCHLMSSRPSLDRVERGPADL